MSSETANYGLELYLVSTLPVQFLLLLKPLHQLLHEFQCDLTVFQFWTYVLILNRCKGENS